MLIRLLFISRPLPFANPTSCQHLGCVLPIDQFFIFSSLSHYLSFFSHKLMSSLNASYLDYFAKPSMAVKGGIIVKENDSTFLAFLTLMFNSNLYFCLNHFSGCKG